MPPQVTLKNTMPIIATSETACTDAVLEHSRLIAQQNMRQIDYRDIPEKNRDLYYQALTLIDAAHEAVRVIADNSWENAMLPHGRINQLRNDAVRLAAEIPNILASGL